jgi:hypothetical protein
MMFRKLALAAAASLAAFGAQATDYDFGIHDFAEASFLLGGGVVPGAGAFMDSYAFELGAPVTLTSTVVALNQAPILTISGGTYHVLGAGTDGIFATGDDFVVPATAYSFDGTTGSTSNALILGAGKYAYIVEGTTTGLAGYYTLFSSVSAVPEPESLSLLLAGIGLIGFVASRRRT